MKGESAIQAHEIGNTYVGPEDRYVVSLVVGYVEDLECQSPEDAACWALRLTQDEGSHDTHWYVYDRVTKQMHRFKQSQFDPEYTENWP